MPSLAFPFTLRRRNTAPVHPSNAPAFASPSSSRTPSTPASTTSRRPYTSRPQVPQFLLHQALAFNPQLRHGSYVEPSLLWDMRLPPDSHARLASAPRHRLPSAMLSQLATNPAVPVLRLVCNLFPHKSWTVEAYNPRGVTVGDLLYALHRSLRKRVTNEEWAQTPRAHQARVAEAFYARVRASADPGHEQRAGVRRIDWLLKSTQFVGLTPSTERGYTWTLTTKRVDSK